MRELITAAVQRKDQGESENGFGDASQETTAVVQVRNGSMVESMHSGIREVLRNTQKTKSQDFGSLNVWEGDFKGVHVSLTLKVFSCEWLVVVVLLLRQGTLRKEQAWRLRG